MSEIVVKRYKNRKLYAVSAAEYVTLQDVLDLALEDIDFTVIDQPTGKDITADTLLMALMQEAKGKLPLAAVKSMISQSKSAIQMDKDIAVFQEAIEKLTEEIKLPAGTNDE